MLMMVAEECVVIDDVFVIVDDGARYDDGGG